MATQSVYVVAGGDDALSYSASLGTISGVQTNDTSAVFGKYVNNYFYEVWFLFKSIDFGSGDTINSCVMNYELASNSVGGGNTLNINWAFYNADDATAISDATGAQTARDAMTTTVSDSFTTETGAQTTPDLSVALQDVADRGGWSSGNDVLLIGTYASSDGQDYVQPYMYDYGGGSKAPELAIDYSAGPPPSTFKPTITVV